MANFTGTGGDDLAHANFGTLNGFSGGSVAELQDNVGDSFNGLSGDDTIIAGNGGDDTILGGGGADEMRGQDGNDTFFFRPGQIVSGEIVDGGNGANAVHFEAAPADASVFEGRSATFIGISSLTFNINNTGVFAHFWASQFTGGQFAQNLAVSCGINDILTWRIEMSSQSTFDMSGFVFAANWGTGQKIEILGDGDAETIIGSDEADFIDGSAGADHLFGGTGADTLEGSHGNDTMEGGQGNDVYFVKTASDVVVELATSGSGKDTIRTEVSIAALAANVEVAVAIVGGALNITGNASNNTISGNVSANTVSGLAGNDALSTAQGNDKLQGGLGADTLNAGWGGDQFVYGALAECGDTVEDFGNVSGNNDVFKFRGTAFGSLPDGPIAANQFEANTTGVATQATTRFVYETDTAILRFDSNGSAAGGVTVVATLQAGATMTAADINIF